MSILTIKAGSSSIRFAFYASGSPPKKLLSGKIDRIGFKDAVLASRGPAEPPRIIPVPASDHSSAVQNDLDRYHLVIDAAKRLPQTGSEGAYLKQAAAG